MLTPSPAVLRIPEVAEILRCTDPTVRKLIREGKLQATRVGTRLRVEPAAVEDYLARERLPGPVAPGADDGRDLPDGLRKYL